jgi:ferric-dicitrate binding protein FerR (iron transport regulator)
MEKDYQLAKWLNNELSEAELAAFKASPDYELYEKIKKYSGELNTPEIDDKAMLAQIFTAEKTKPKVIPLYKNLIFRVAAIVLVVIGIVFTTTLNGTQTYLAENGQKTSLTLPDNSQVVLNSGSTINYKKNDWDNNRKLELEGEAYFKVAKGKKFEVNTNLGKVTVLGTQFNVKVRDSRFNVTCYEGRVKVTYNNQEVIITRGQGVSFKNDKKINTTLAVPEYPEWLQNEISFDQELLNDIVKEIERQYNVSIELKKQEPVQLFTGKIPSNNLDIALDIIGTTFHLKTTRISKDKIVLEP